MYPEIYLANVRPDGSASYFDINPEPPPLSIRDRGWDGVVFEREYFEPFETGEIVYDEHMIGICMGQDIPILHATDGYRLEGVYRVGELVISPAGQPVQWRVESGGGGERIFVESCSNVMALHFLKHHTSLVQRPDRPIKRGLTGPKLRRAIKVINDRLEEGVSLREIAEAAGVSTSRLSVLFRRSTGLSPHQYLIRRRVEKAKLLLRIKGDHSPSLPQIAARCGFVDQGHLARHFRRLTGLAPSTFREMP